MATATAAKSKPKAQSFTERALYWLNEYRTHPKGDPEVNPPIKLEIGSRWVREQKAKGNLGPEKLKLIASECHVTDCITFVTDVLQRAYHDIGYLRTAAK